MTRFGSAACFLAIVATAARLAAQTPAAGQRAAQPPTPPPDAYFSKSAPADLVEFEMMTWPEVYRAIHEQGKTTALIYTGGTEQRGPQNVNGGHTLMARATVKAIALALGNAIAMPVLPFTPNNASAALPGTIGLTNDLLAAMLEQVTEETIKTGFTNVILMGDHGGGQPAVYRDVATKLDAKHAADGLHVYFCDEVYAKANNDFDEYLRADNLPVSSHAGIPDTSEMLYLGGDKGWVRQDLIPIAVGAPGGRGGRGGRGQQAGSAATPQTAPATPAAPRINNGIQGDARPSSVELGKKIFDMKVDYAVAQIRRLTGK